MLSSVHHTVEDFAKMQYRHTAKKLKGKISLCKRPEYKKGHQVHRDKVNGHINPVKDLHESHLTP